MKREWGWWTTCVVLVVFGGVLGRAIGGGPTAAERALADTLRVQQRTLSVQVRANDSLRTELQQATHRLTLAAVGKLAPARLHTDTLVTTSVQVLTDSAALHTVRNALAAERAACDTAIAALGAEVLGSQTATAEVRGERDAALRLQVRTQGALDAALRIRTPARTLLGLTVGYGGVWRNGRVQLGPSVNAGLTVKLPLPRIL
jgi:hypothetical protein